MKIKVVSDLHIEFNGPYDFKKNETYLVAGDIAPVDMLIPYLNDVSKETNIIFIAGNHEFYNNSLNDYNTIREAFKDSPNITFLQDDFITLQGKTGPVNVYGTTLWTNLKSTQYDRTYLENYGKMRMNDFHCITNKDGIPFHPSEMTKIHNESMEKMTTFFLEHKGESNIIMSHHSPSFQSVGRQYLGDTLNYFFASRLEDYIEEHSPIMWIHGHMHTRKDYFIDDTRVLCNPHGYPRESVNFGETTIHI